MAREARLAAALLALPLIAAAPGPVAFDTHLTGDGVFAAAKARPIDVPVVKSDGYERAPMPDQDIDRPRAAESDSNEPRVQPSLFNTKVEYSGEGYTTRGGSSVGANEARKKPGVGLNWSVPVD
jgi:hypothetical protein